MNSSLKIKLTLLLLLVIGANGFSQAKLQIKDAKKNFGFVKKGDIVKLDYEITNIGNQPLLLNNIEIECSCTTAEYDKDPILPGKTSVITIIFDTKSAYDRQDRTVSVTSNDSKGPHKLRYKGVVLKT